MVSEIFHAEKQRDIKKLIVAFRKYGNVVELSCIPWHIIFRNFNTPNQKYLISNL
jgi:hypothetical protein